jgi:hypothetical protein
MGEVAHNNLFVCKGFFIGPRRIKGASLQWIEQQGKRAHFLGRILLGTLSKLERSLLLYQVPLYLLLVVSHALDITYIYFHSKLVFPGGVLSRVMLTKNTCVHFSCMLSV